MQRLVKGVYFMNSHFAIMFEYSMKSNLVLRERYFDLISRHKHFPLVINTRDEQIVAGFR